MLPKPFLFLYLLLFVICLSSCDYRKYNDGPYFSVYPTENRLANTWNWQLAILDDEPLTGQYSDSTITFVDDATVQICNMEGNCREGEWSLVSKRTRLQLIFGQETQLFDIQMLKRNEIWLRTAVGDSAIVEWELVPANE